MNGRLFQEKPAKARHGHLVYLPGQTDTHTQWLGELCCLDLASQQARVFRAGAGSWWQHKLVEPLGKAHLTTPNIRPYDPATPLLGVRPRTEPLCPPKDTNRDADSSVVYNGREVEATHMSMHSK